jgi:DNA repair exonuclease SbcCD ATPase subunit
MPTILKDADGNDIEVETADEVNARIESERQLAADEARATLEAEKEQALQEKEAELLEAQEKLKKLEDKDYNFSKLRNKTEKDETELKKTLEKLSQDVSELKGLPVQQQKDSFVDTHIGSDQELKDKFEHYYTRLGKDAKTNEERAAALKESLILAGGTQQGASFIARAIPTAGNPNIPTGDEVSQEAKEFGAALGVSDEDRKKYGSGSINLFGK